MTKATKKILVRYIIAPILMVIFLWLIYLQLLQKGDLQGQWNELKLYWHIAPSSWAIVVIALAPLNWFWEALKWRLAMLKVYPVKLITAYKAVLTGIAFAMITPGKVGDFAGRILYVPNSKKLHATLATLMTNVIQVLATSTIGLVGIVFFLFYAANDWLWRFVWIFSLAVLLLIGLIISSKWWWKKISHWKFIQKLKKTLHIFKYYKKTTLLKIYAFSLLRFLTYNLQFLLLANLLGSQTPWFEGIFATFLMFWLITLIPSLIVSDIGVRGFLASMLFLDTGLALNGVSLLSASYIIWLLNLILPAILGSLLIISIRHSNNKHDTSTN